VRWNDPANGGINPTAATQRARRVRHGRDAAGHPRVERKTLDPHLARWRLRVVPPLGHIPVRMITNGVVDRAGYSWIEDECSRSTVKNMLAILVRVLEQPVRDGGMDRNVARSTAHRPDIEPFSSWSGCVGRSGFWLITG
jgi:hypothetical protein